MLAARTMACRGEGSGAAHHQLPLRRSARKTFGRQLRKAAVCTRALAGTPHRKKFTCSSSPVVSTTLGRNVASSETRRGLYLHATILASEADISLWQSDNETPADARKHTNTWRCSPRSIIMSNTEPISGRVSALEMPMRLTQPESEMAAENGTRLSAVRAGSDARPSKVRSAVTNGKRLHVVAPGDTKWARRFRDVLGQIVSDLGGPDGLSEGQRQLARRATTLAIMCEKLEGEAATGNAIDLEQYGVMTDRLGRAFQRLGLRRQARDVTPDPLEYAREHAS